MHVLIAAVRSMTPVISARCSRWAAIIGSVDSPTTTWPTRLPRSWPLISRSLQAPGP